jgi:hypothetical protein
MAKTSIRDRLLKLENARRFLDWFVWDRFYASLTEDEIEIYARNGNLQEPIPNRPCWMDKRDRKSLLKLWKEHELSFGERSHEELDYCTKNGCWPEERGRLHYSLHDGKLGVEWQFQSEGEDQREKTDQPTYSTATPNNQPTQLIEMAGLEIRRRALSQELAHVNSEMSRLNLEIRVLGIEIPWLARGRRGGIR